MAYAVVQELPGIAPDVYKRVMAGIGIGDEAPPGMIVHASGLVDGTLRMIEIWQSRGDRDRFLRERVEPARAAVARPGERAGVPPHDHFEIDDIEHLLIGPQLAG